MSEDGKEALICAIRQVFFEVLSDDDKQLLLQVENESY